MADYKDLDQLIGAIVKSDPVVKETPSGKTVMAFTVRQQINYDDEDNSKFVDVSIWEEGRNGKNKLFGYVKGKLFKGTVVSLVGVRKDGGQYNDKFTPFEVYISNRLSGNQEEEWG
jgi:Single-strand binding protein family